MDEYWNHNTAHHAWLIGGAAPRPRHVADDVLPSALTRPGLYYRYRLHWRND